MMAHLASLLAMLVALCFAPAALQATEARLVSIETPRGATQAFLLLKPEKPIAAVILFAGGMGPWA